MFMTNQKISGIDGLRAIAALIIMWGHIAQKDFGDWNGSIASLTLPQECVTLFFLITGFLASVSLSPQIDYINYGNYYRKRFARICPLYFLYTAVSLLVFILLGRSAEISTHSLFYYLLLSGEIPFTQHTGILPLVHLWFIGDIVLFYIVFPIILKNTKERIILTSLGIIATGCIIKYGSYLIFGKCILYKFVSTLRISPIWTGAIIGVLYHRENRMLSKLLNNNIVFFISLFFFLLSGYYDDLIPAPLRIEFFTSIYAVFLISVFGNNSIKHLMLDNKALNSIGQISYGIYVIHPMIIIFISYLWRLFELNSPDLWSSMIIYIVITLTTMGLAKISSEYFEKPIINRIVNHASGLHV